MVYSVQPAEVLVFISSQREGFGSAIISIQKGSSPLKSEPFLRIHRSRPRSIVRRVGPSSKSEVLNEILPVR